MTQDEIIELARQAGFQHPDAVGQCEDFAYFELETFAKLIALPYQKKIADLENIICQSHWDVLQEREACAKVAICYDSEPWKHTPAYSHVADMVSVEIGKAIRARGQA